VEPLSRRARTHAEHADAAHGLAEAKPLVLDELGDAARKRREMLAEQPGLQGFEQPVEDD